VSARVTITFKTYSGGTRLASCPSSEKLPYSRGIHQMRAARAYEICCDFLFKIFTYLALIITVHVIRRFCFYSLGTTIQMISCRARLVTMDETRLYHHDPETKQQSMEWRHSGSPRTKIFRVQKSAGKFSPRFFGIKTPSSSLIIFQRAKLSTRSITHLCWCN